MRQPPLAARPRYWLMTNNPRVMKRWRLLAAICVCDSPERKLQLPCKRWRRRWRKRKREEEERVL